MGTAFYAFRDSASDNAKTDINTVMNNIRATLARIDSDVTTLRGSWDASEAEAYEEIMKKWNEGATNLNNVLNDVQTALQAHKDGNTALREAISKVLDESS